MIGQTVLKILPMTFFLILIISSSSSLASATTIPFDTIEKGQSPGELTGTFTKVYGNVQDFAVFWSQHVNMKEQSDDDDDNKTMAPPPSPLSIAFGSTTDTVKRVARLLDLDMMVLAVALRHSRCRDKTLLS